MKTRPFPLTTCTQAPSLTSDPLLLDTGSLHRVDARQLTDHRTVHVAGAIEQRQCRPGMCQGLPTCGDHHCQGHPVNEVKPEERDGPLLLKVVLAYAATLAAVGWCAWQWLSR